MVQCPNCGGEYDQLGRHLAACGYPPLSDWQKELIVGMVLGDGYIKADDHNARLSVQMTNEDFVRWFADELEWLATNVVDAGRQEEHWSDVYRVFSRRHPELTEMRGRWYQESGDRKKRVPEGFVPSPMELKLWYCSDGSINQQKENWSPWVKIAMKWALNDENRVEKMFKEIGLEPSLYHGTAQFSADGTEQFFEYIGGPLPGFEYKWPGD